MENKNIKQQKKYIKIQLHGKIEKEEKYETIIHYSTAGVEIYRERRIKTL